MADWLGSAGFDRDREDHWPRQWAEAYVNFAAGEKRSYLHELGLKVMPTVGWAERGSGSASGHGNSVPRFHITWGTGPEVVRVFREPVLAGAEKGLVTFKYRHQVDEIIAEGGRAVGVRGTVLVPSTESRGVSSSRERESDFEAAGTGGCRHVRWHRRQLRVGEEELARRSVGSGARAHDHRRSRTR